MTLLIADDEFIIRKGLMSLKWDTIGINEILCAENGIEARKILKENNIDILITDIKMPGLTGLELAEYIKSNSKNTRIVLLSGFSDFEYARSAIRSNVIEYLLKPIKPNELLKTVKLIVKEIEAINYKNKLINEFENMSLSMSLTEQILHSFRQSNDTVLEILKYMSENYMHDISLSSISEKYHFSSIHLSRLIKKETQYSYIDILTGIRMLNALSFFRNTKDKVNIVCEKIGLNDQRYFSQIFKKTFGFTPIEYRKSNELHKDYSLKELLDMMCENKYKK